MNMLIHLAKQLILFLYKAGNILLPFQTQYLVNKLLKGKRGNIVCRLLTLSMDWPDEQGCANFWEALGSDFSFRRNRMRKMRMQFSREENKKKTYFLDVTNYYRHDDKTGLHRRIYELLRFLLAQRDMDCRIIYYAPRTKGYRYATLLANARFPESRQHQDPVVFHRGDTLTLMQAAVPDGIKLEDFAKHEIEIISVVDDVIPIQHPEMVRSNVGFIHAFKDIMAHSSKVLSVSMTAVMEIKQCAKEKGYPVNPKMQYGCFYNGCDFRKPVANELTEEEKEITGHQPFVLGIGTFEPRKGYREAIKAFEQLWNQGEELSYVIAGRTGVSTGSFIEDCKKHPQYQKHLFLAIGASDQMLASLYEHCLFVLNCSHAEGFGIPLMEATFYRKPILARRLPVFQEIMKDQIRYFDDSDPLVLSHHIKEAEEGVQNKTFLPADKEKIEYYSWEEVGQIFAGFIR